MFIQIYKVTFITEPYFKRFEVMFIGMFYIVIDFIFIKKLYLL